MQQTPKGNIGKYEIYKTLGTGGTCKVKLGLDTESNRWVAVKILSDKMDYNAEVMTKNEVNAMAMLDNQHIIKQYESGQGLYNKTSGKQKTVRYIVLELAQSGCLFDVIAQTGAMKEDLARYYFRQFVVGLDHCHTAGVTHRDLKPENLLLGADSNLKLADFGYAAPLAGRDGSGYLETHCGTMGYMAPEIHLRQKYNGKSVDIFSAAIILFIMVAQHPPFVEATNNDIYYKCLAVNRADLFWTQHSKNKPSGYFSEEFKDFIQSCLQKDPQHRPTLPELMGHPWMTQGNMLSLLEVQKEFAMRMKKIKSDIELEQDSLMAQKDERLGEVNRSAADQNSANKFNLSMEDIQKQTGKTLDQYFDGGINVQKHTEYLSTYEPQYLEAALIQFVRETLGVNPVISSKKYKIKFTLIKQHPAAQDQDITIKTEICVRILQYDQTRVCVEFQKVKGDQAHFIELFQEMRDQSLQWSNNSVADVQNQTDQVPLSETTDNTEQLVQS